MDEGKEEGHAGWERGGEGDGEVASDGGVGFVGLPVELEGGCDAGSAVEGGGLVDGVQGAGDVGVGGFGLGEDDDGGGGGEEGGALAWGEECAAKAGGEEVVGDGSEVGCVEAVGGDEPHEGEGLHEAESVAGVLHEFEELLGHGLGGPCFGERGGGFADADGGAVAGDAPFGGGQAGGVAEGEGDRLEGDEVGDGGFPGGAVGGVVGEGDGGFGELDPLGEEERPSRGAGSGGRWWIMDRSVVFWHERMVDGCVGCSASDIGFGGTRGGCR